MSTESNHISWLGYLLGYKPSSVSTTDQTSVKPDILSLDKVKAAEDMKTYLYQKQTHYQAKEDEINQRISELEESPTSENAQTLRRLKEQRDAMIQDMMHRRSQATSEAFQDIRENCSDYKYALESCLYQRRGSGIGQMSRLYFEDSRSLGGRSYSQRMNNEYNYGSECQVPFKDYQNCLQTQKDIYEMMGFASYYAIMTADERLKFKDIADEHGLRQRTTLTVSPQQTS